MIRHYERVLWLAYLLRVHICYLPPPICLPFIQHLCKKSLLRMVITIHMDLNRFRCRIGMLTYMDQMVKRLMSSLSQRNITCKSGKSIATFCSKELLNTHFGTFGDSVNALLHGVHVPSMQHHQF
jgi:hypothetical protein